jgi:hypothetical protein
MDPTTITGWVSERVLFSVHAFNLHVIVNLCIGVYKLIKYNISLLFLLLFLLF